MGVDMESEQAVNNGKGEKGASSTTDSATPAATSAPPPRPPRRRPVSAFVSSLSFSKSRKNLSLESNAPPLPSLDTALASNGLQLSDDQQSPLSPPSLPFSSSRRRTRSSSASSTASSTPSHSHGPSSSSSSLVSLNSLARTARPRIPLLPVPSVPVSPTQDDDEMSYRGDDLSSAGGLGAQEELLDDRAIKEGGGGYVDPYAWERPLDAVNRHSRQFDTRPVSVAGSAYPSFGAESSPNPRRVSRLPPGVAMVDPFGFDVTSDPSPYDLASLSQPPSASPAPLSRSSPNTRTSYLGPQAPPRMTSSPQYHNPRASTSASPYPPSTTSPGSSDYGHGSQQPWTGKPRASSMNEQQGMGYKAQLRNGLLSPGGLPRGVSQRSKLSGEIDADAVSIASVASRATTGPTPASVAPTDSDYLNSKLYQRTLKAQKALEKERAKAASKGKLSRYDQAEASKSTGSLLPGSFDRRLSTDSGRPRSIMSAVGVAGSTGKRSGRKSGLGWFRSSSEAALELDASKTGTEHITPPLPASRSSSQLSSLGGGGGVNGFLSFGGSGGPSPGGSGNSTPLPPSPNLPSEATLRAMGVTDSQMRSSGRPAPAPLLSSRPGSGGNSPQTSYRAELAGGAANGRPKSGGRQGSGGGAGGGGSRSPHASMQPRVSPVPPSPTESNFSVDQQQQPPALRGASLAPSIAVPPPSASSTLANNSRPISSRTSSLEPPKPSPQASPALSAVPPQAALAQAPLPTPTPARRMTAEETPLPPSAPPTQETFDRSQRSQRAPPPPVGAAPPQPYQQRSPQQVQQPLPPARNGSAPPPPSNRAAPPPAPSSGSSARPTPTATPASSSSSLAPPPTETVKRRKSALGGLFSRSSSSSASSQSGQDRSGSSTPTSNGLAKVKEEGGKKLVKEEKKSGGGFFSFGGSSSSASKGEQEKLRSSASAAAAEKAKKAKKVDEPFFHPSQALHASRPSPPVAAPRSPLPRQSAVPVSPTAAQIRAVNASPLLPQSQSQPTSPNPGQQHPPTTALKSGPPGPEQNGTGGSPRTDSSSGSSTTFSSLSSSSSTLPPGTPANLQPIYIDSSRAPQTLGKKNAFSSFFSNGGGDGGSVRKRTTSTPNGSSPAARMTAPPKALPGVPPVSRNPPRGQSLGVAGQQQGQPTRNSTYA